MKISGKTKVYGIIGNPVEHSLSPLFQSWFLEQSGVDAVYVPFHVKESEIKSAVQGLWVLGVEGFNVTVPHKESVLPYIEADESVRAIGAANTVIRGEQGWQATNTDWIGFSDAVQATGADLEGATVLLFGAGGTAKAVIYALAKQGVHKLFLCNRGRKRAEMLAAFARDNYSRMSCELVEWSEADVERISLKSNIVINTTSIGLCDGDQFPFGLPGDGVAIDVVYRPDGKTAFCREAAESGRPSVDGLPMLIAQGAVSFSKWHDTELPNRLAALRWTEKRIGRSPVDLPGWEIEV